LGQPFAEQRVDGQICKQNLSYAPDCALGSAEAAPAWRRTACGKTVVSVWFHTMQKCVSKQMVRLLHPSVLRHRGCEVRFFSTLLKTVI